MMRKVELLAGDRDGGVVLRSPGVGYFTSALPAGSLVGPGAGAGMIRVLGETVVLVVPRGVTARVVSERPERVHHPVGYGDVLYELAPIEAGVAEAEAAEARASGVPAFRAACSGRFWHRPSPGVPPFVQAGDVIRTGDTVGLVEVMKTFTHVVYEPTGVNEGLPGTARVVELLVGDGDEITEGEALFAVEQA
jgi:biotin carboxyl carrier protein